MLQNVIFISGSLAWSNPFHEKIYPFLKINMFFFIRSSSSVISLLHFHLLGSNYKICSSIKIVCKYRSSSLQIYTLTTFSFFLQAEIYQFGNTFYCSALYSYSLKVFQCFAFRAKRRILLRVNSTIEIFLNQLSFRLWICQMRE